MTPRGPLLAPAGPWGPRRATISRPTLVAVPDVADEGEAPEAHDEHAARVMPFQVVVAQPDRAIRFLLTVPVTRFGVGPFSVDPVERLVGCPLADLPQALRR